MRKIEILLHKLLFDLYHLEPGGVLLDVLKVFIASLPLSLYLRIVCLVYIIADPEQSLLIRHIIRRLKYDS